MKKYNLTLILTGIIIILLIIIIAVGIAVFLYYKKINNENTGALVAANADALIEINTEKDITEIPILIPPNPAFDPALLNWKEALASAPWEKRDSHAVAVYKNKIWVMGGVDANGHVISPGDVDYGNSPYFSDVWSSIDGKNWQLVLNKAPWGNRRSIEVVDFKGKMWLMGGWGPEVGYRNDIWSSTDGINWKQEIAHAAWPAREGHQLVVFKNKVWLLGGVNYGKHTFFPWFFGGISFGKNQLFNDVWSSEDGINWKEATNNAGWSPRWDDAAGVFDNKLWVIDGMSFKSQLFNDVWSSEDGVTWSLVTQNPPFASRQGNAIIDYQNKLWVVGRLNADEYGGGANDVWYSSDGINWKKTKTDPLWSGREDVGIIVFKDRIWVLGGMDKNYIWNNDVWYSTSNIN